MKKGQRQKRSEHKFKRRAGWLDTHHLRSQKRGGSSRKYNRIELDAYRHDAWHLLFDHLTLREVIELLERLEQIKESQF